MPDKTISACLQCTLPICDDKSVRCCFVQIRRAERRDKPKPPSHLKREAEAAERRRTKQREKRRQAKNKRGRDRYAENKRTEMRKRKTQLQRKYRTRDGIKKTILSVLLALGTNEQGRV